MLASVWCVFVLGTGKLFDVRSRKCRARLEGHEGDVSKVTIMLTQLMGYHGDNYRLHSTHKALGC